MSSATPKYWLLKAEPDTRIVKGKDVKFSVDDFERVKTSPWEGVRNYEARNLMKEMKEGDQAVFYHSNCKVPGIAAFAEVSKEAYPDYTAWDSSHPYYDAKSDSNNPRWYMVDLSFKSRASHFIPLALLRKISEISMNDIPEELSYLDETDVHGIKRMDLVTRGRLSVQRVQEDAWRAIEKLAEKGGWDDIDLKPGKTTKSKAKTSTANAQPKAASLPKSSGTKVDPQPNTKAAASKRKREEAEADPDEAPGLRRSTRNKK
ncbi:hypothetical protein D9613_004805 [Agrocybe pediades]|uniref:EVE domain-containing protein n=1 Tax=Agrocybe pediades TaxID=84607 RepID=A0A8H4QXW6_9AGAR|nr:hypothetical protein D9613_004805 [Agrocybe pediades]